MKAIALCIFITKYSLSLPWKKFKTHYAMHFTKKTFENYFNVLCV